jgi:hypothetical protein
MVRISFHFSQKAPSLQGVSLFQSPYRFMTPSVMTCICTSCAPSSDKEAQASIANLPVLEYEGKKV